MFPQRPWAYERGTLWALDLDHEPPSPVAHSNATLAEVQHAGIAPLTTAMGLRNTGEVQRRFNAGSRCFSAWVAGKIASYSWVSWGMECIGEFERSLRMRPDEAYIWDCATLSPYRRKGLYTALLRYVASTLHQQGTRRMWIAAALNNQPSIRGFTAAGFRPAIRLTYLRVLMARGVWVHDESGAPPGLAVEARRALVESHDAVVPPQTSRGLATIRSAADRNCL